MKRTIGRRGLVSTALGGMLFAFAAAVFIGRMKGHDATPIALREMIAFPFDQTAGRLQDVPKRWRALEGHVVAMRGEIAPGSESVVGGTPWFDLVPDLARSGPGPSPRVQDFVRVSVPASAAMHVTDARAVEVRGVLCVAVTHDPETGRIDGVFHMTADQIDSVGTEAELPAVADRTLR